MKEERRFISPGKILCVGHSSQLQTRRREAGERVGQRVSRCFPGFSIIERNRKFDVKGGSGTFDRGGEPG